MINDRVDVPLTIAAHSSSDEEYSTHSMQCDSSVHQPSGRVNSQHTSEVSEQTCNSSSTEEYVEPLMDDISTLLETMHTKNLTLKKLAKMQQVLIEGLRQENAQLKEEVDHKNKLVDISRAKIATLEQNLSDQTFRKRSMSTASSSDTPWNNGSVYSYQDTERESMAISEEKQSRVFNNVGQGIKSKQRSAIMRMKQIVAKINNVGNKSQPASVVFNLYALSWSALTGTARALLPLGSQVPIGTALVCS